MLNAFGCGQVVTERHGTRVGPGPASLMQRDSKPPRDGCGRLSTTPRLAFSGEQAPRCGEDKLDSGVVDASDHGRSALGH